MKKFTIYISVLIALMMAGCSQNVEKSEMQGEGIFNIGPEFSEEYLVGLDYGGMGWGTIYQTIDARVIICTNHDVLIYMPTDIDINAREKSLELVETLTLTDEQYENIENSLDRKKLYKLIVISNSQICDGDNYTLYLYDKEQNIAKSCGGYMPITKKFWDIYDAIIENIPTEKILEIRDSQIKKLIRKDWNLKCGATFIDAFQYDAETIKEMRKEEGVISHIDIATMEKDSEHYSEFEDLVLGECENSNKVWMDVADKRWQHFVLDELAPELIAKDIDGFLIDGSNIYAVYPTKEILNGLATIMKGLKDKEYNVVINNGESFVEAYTDSFGEWSGIFDGIRQENVICIYDPETGRSFEAPENHKEHYLEYLTKYGNQGAAIFIQEYIYSTNMRMEYQIPKVLKKYFGTINYRYYISEID